MSAYFVAQIRIHDPAAYGRYLDGFDEVFARYRGEVVAVDEATEVLEGEWPAARTVLIRFPNKQELLRWYRSPDYQALAAQRRRGADCNVAAVEGRD